MSLIRLAVASSLVLALSACGGGGIGNILSPVGGNTVQCDPGTQVQLANPQPGETGVSGNIGQIVIVANGDNNTLNNTFGQWYVTLTDQYGHSIQGGNLARYSYRNGPHPYTNDFYYSSSIGQLPAGATWSAKLSEQTSDFCTPMPLQSFST